jgi:DNA-binding LytR/AlgR family response regulator
MKQINCIIIDDEPYANKILEDFIDKVPYINLAGVYTNPLEALVKIKNDEINLVFLDINMPELSGLDLIKMLPKYTEVIITSAYSEFALAGFENNVLDYLLKPYSFDRFLQATNKALDYFMMDSLNNSKSETVDNTEADSFYLKTDRGKLVRVKFSDIVYVEGLKNYCSIFTASDRHISLVSMKTLIEGLPLKDFIRIHKSYIIAIKKISSVDGNMVSLESIKEKIPIGLTYRNDFFTLLSKSLFS